MKKIFITIILFSLCDCISAKVISRSQALEIADAFGPTMSATKGTLPLSSIVHEEFPSDAPSIYNIPACYVINYSTGGYVIVSADDVARPILAYCKRGSFNIDSAPEAEKGWLADMANAIYHSSISNITSSPKTKGEWSLNSNYGLAQNTKEVLLETAAWSQDEPFNKFVPKINGVCPTGCTSTAAAIIMRYHKHPKAGIGTLLGYTSLRGNRIEGHALGHKYDWESMPLKYVRGKYSSYQAEQVAQLMYDLGVSFETDYFPTGSGANFNRALGALVEYFDYDPTVLYISRANFEQCDFGKTWEDLVRSEIDNKRPVLMGSYLEEYKGRHAFVVSGYSGDYFCFNWGWGESEWFGLLTPVDGYDEKITQSPISQEMAYNLRPNEGGVNDIEFVYAGDIFASSWHYLKNVPFYLGIELRRLDDINVYNGFKMEFSYALIDKNRNIKEIVAKEIGTYPYKDGLWVPLECIVTKDFNETDEIALCYRSPGEKNWTVATGGQYSSIKMKSDTPIIDRVNISFAPFGCAFRIPNNAALKFVRNDGIVEGDCALFDDKDLTTPTSYSYYYKYDRGENGILEKQFRESDGVWDVTIYDYNESYSFTIVF